MVVTRIDRLISGVDHRQFHRGGVHHDCSLFLSCMRLMYSIMQIFVCRSEAHIYSQHMKKPYTHHMCKQH
jgi:hypothetical protein